MEIKIQNENELSIVHTAFEGRIEVLRDRIAGKPSSRRCAR